jgi:5-formyltetrahydrofolate cyclo-ligase
MESKKDIRKRVLLERSRLTENAWNLKTDMIYEKLISHPFFVSSNVIYCYVDYRQEVGTCKIIEAAWKWNKKVAVPLVEGEEMQFYYIEDFSDLSEGYRGILEPQPMFPANDDEALVIMPGAAFDLNRNRIGYGKGYYDKFLSGHPNYHTIAVAFELQVLEQIPSELYDIRPEVLITEERIYDGAITE